MNRKNWKEKLLHLAVAAVFALIAGGSVWMFYRYRDAVIAWDWARPAGEFSAEEDADLRRKALRFVEERLAGPGETCVDQWLGRDERYVYLAAGCAKFVERLGQVEAEGDGNFHPLRLRYVEKEIRSLEQPEQGLYFENSLKRLFPREAGRLLSVRMNAEVFRSEGLAKARSESAAP